MLRVTGSGDGWIRFYPNLQICFGYSVTLPQGSVTVNYGAPFSHTPSVNTTIVGDDNKAGAIYTCLVASNNNTAFKLTSFLNGTLVSSVVLYWTAFGYY